MSIAAYKAVWNKSKSKGSERLVLLCLAEHANNEGYCWPGLETIAKETKVSKRQVTRALNGLQDIGEIKYNPGDGRGNRSEFWILLPLDPPQKDDATTPFEVEEKDDISSIKDDILSQRVTFETVKDDTMSSRTIIEPTKNHKEPEVREAPANAFWAIPENLQEKEFLKTWKMWLKHVDEAKLTFTETQAALILAKLSDAGLPLAIKSVENSLSRGWKNLHVFDPAMNGHPNGRMIPAPAEERIPGAQ